MDETEEVVGVALVAHDQATIVAQPGEESLYLPSALVPPQGSAVLSLLPASAMWGYHLDALLSQLTVEPVRVVSLVSNQMLRKLLYELTGQRVSNKGDFVRASTRCASGERKTRTVCHCHDFRTFAPLGLANTRPPFFATTKVPSMKHSLTSSPPLSLRSLAKASSTPRMVPSRTQAWKRRWQVWYGGYLSGRSCQGAPVRRIHNTPLSTSRLSLQGLPRPSALLGSSPISGFTTAHCSSVKSIATPSSRSSLPTLYRFMR